MIFLLNSLVHKRLVWCVTAVWISLLATLAQSTEPEVCVIRADGTEVCGTVTSWDDTRIVIGADTAQTVATDNIAEIRFPRAKRRPQTSDWIVLGTTDRFPLTVQRIEDDSVTAIWARSSRRPELRFPLENVTAIVRQMPPAAVVQREWLSTIERLPPGKDVIRLVVGEDLAGEFTAWENGLVKWQGSLGAIQLDLQRVRWIRFDPELTTKPTRPDVWWSVFLTDGARFTATACRPQTDHSVEWILPVGGSVTVPRHEVIKATRWSPRRQLLSKREPTETKLTPFLSGHRTLVSDRSASHSPLMIRGEEFATGTGMQSRAEVTYAMQANDHHFTATVGIDDAAEGRGSARFAVRVDDRIVWTSDELTGTSPAMRLPPIPLTGAKTLTLIVEYGEYADVGDLADWCDASLWQTPRGD